LVTGRDENTDRRGGNADCEEHLGVVSVPELVTDRDENTDHRRETQTMRRAVYSGAVIVPELITDREGNTDRRGRSFRGS
jgi:hypothetical protein